ncbi:TlpA disulfide reductase family protein [Pedobacter lusitanus]|uniref:TlpA disulfide reductase family protein n=1 Tax=Pedobacter lusitanus TaxID=1503925 RepID=UPI0006980FC8|nr:TlpA disulfide reductase family protein [Pedobacter lusitanus]
MKLKSTILLALFALTINASAQQEKNTYTISGHLEGLKDEWIYIENDSAQIKNDRFKFTGQTTEPIMVHLYTKSKPHIYLSLFVDKNGITSIEGKADSYDESIITGNTAQTEYNKLNAQNMALNLQKKKLFSDYKAAAAAKDSTKIISIEKAYEVLDQQTESAVKAFIKQNPKSFVSVYQIQDMEYKNNAETLDELFKSLDSSVQKSVFGTKLNAMIAVKKKSSIGQPIMEFSQPDESGNLVSISSFKGKYVLLDFWASWCGPCRAENPNILKAYNQFKDKGFNIFSVSIDNNKEKWLKAINDDHLSWIQVSDLKKENEAAKQFGIRGIPSNFLIDPNGKIIGVNLRGEELLKKLQEVIK